MRDVGRKSRISREKSERRGGLIGSTGRTKVVGMVWEVLKREVELELRKCVYYIEID